MLKKIILSLIVTAILALVIYGLFCSHITVLEKMISTFCVTFIYCIVLILGLLIISDDETTKSPIHLDQVNSEILLITKVFKDKVELYTYTEGAPLNSKKFKDYNKKFQNYIPCYVYLNEISEGFRFKEVIITIREDSLEMLRIEKVK